MLQDAYISPELDYIASVTSNYIDELLEETIDDVAEYLCAFLGVLLEEAVCKLGETRNVRKQYSSLPWTNRPNGW